MRYDFFCSLEEAKWVGLLGKLKLKLKLKFRFRFRGEGGVLLGTTETSHTFLVLRPCT
jgi:hypothetical protein